MRIPIVLPDCVAADTATFSCERILAADGFTRAVYTVPDGCCLNTRRAYGFITAGCDSCDILAIDSGCGSRVFLLDADMREIDAVQPRVDAGPLLSVYCCGGSRLLLTYRKLVAVADFDGRISSVIREDEGDEIDYISAYPICGGYLLAEGDGQRDIIRYNRCGDSTECVLPACVRVKGFTADSDGNVYAFIRKGYPYTFLSTVLENGVFDCRCIQHI